MGIAREGTVEALIRGVRTGPSGPGVAALFDLDRTLIDGYSAISFFNHRLRSGRMAAGEIASSLAAAAAFRLGRIGFTAFLSATTAAARGLPEVALRELGEEVFERQLAARIFPEARRLVEAHRQRGHFLAIVTSATRYQVEPIARHLGIEFVACSGLEVRNGLFTGRVRHPVCYGPGKLDAARRFAARHGFELARASFYSDSHEDLPLLEAVGDPHPVNPTRELAETAAARRWPIHVFAPPPGPMRRWLDDLDARWLSSGRRSARPEAA
jgi:putative phosphoserine phosphatase/1-acylglycerol-3-phosphate O-acyltransferase